MGPGGSVDDALEDVGEPGKRLDAVELCGSDQRRHQRPVLCAGVVAGEQGVLSTADQNQAGAVAYGPISSVTNNTQEAE